MMLLRKKNGEGNLSMLGSGASETQLYYLWNI
jgi:hypothetical protein